MTQQSNIQLVYADRPEILETYADTLEKLSIDSQTLRLEFCVTRMNEPQPPKPLTGKKYTSCRLVMPPSGLLDMFNKLNNLISLLEQQGLVKRDTNQVVSIPPGTKPN